MEHMKLSGLWKRLRRRGAEPRLSEAERELDRQELKREHEKVVDQYFEEGHPSQEVLKGSLWIP